MSNQIQTRVDIRYLRTRLVVFVFLGTLVAIADQWTKSLVMTSINMDSGVTLIPGFINLVHARNSGAAFGIMSQPAAGLGSTFLVLVSLATILGILVLVCSSRKMDCYLLIGYSLFFGGALGNLVDRIRLGEVVDFLDVYVGNYHWPAFNVADSALCIGVAFFLIHAFRGTTDS